MNFNKIRKYVHGIRNDEPFANINTHTREATRDATLNLIFNFIKNRRIARDETRIKITVTIHFHFILRKNLLKLRARETKSIYSAKLKGNIV